MDVIKGHYGILREHLECIGKRRVVSKRFPDQYIDVGGKCSRMSGVQMLRCIQIDKITEVMVHIRRCNDKLDKET